MDKDYKLIKQIKKGDEEATERFISKYYGDIYAYCYKKTMNKETAEDITQEVFVKFYSNIENYVHKGKAKNYLYVIAGNMCKNYYKKQGLQMFEAMGNKKYEEKYEEKYTIVDNHITLQEVLGELSKEQREVIVLHYLRGLKLKEISVVKGITVSLVKYRLKKGVQRLSKLLQRGDWSR